MVGNTVRQLMGQVSFLAKRPDPLLPSGLTIWAGDQAARIEAFGWPLFPWETKHLDADRSKTVHRHRLRRLGERFAIGATNFCEESAR